LVQAEVLGQFDQGRHFGMHLDLLVALGRLAHFQDDSL
jgi:hypothetical protein